MDVQVTIFVYDHIDCRSSSLTGCACEGVSTTINTVVAWWCDWLTTRQTGVWYIKRTDAEYAVWVSV